MAQTKRSANNAVANFASEYQNFFETIIVSQMDAYNVPYAALAVVELNNDSSIQTFHAQVFENIAVRDNSIDRVISEEAREENVLFRVASTSKSFTA